MIFLAPACFMIDIVNVTSALLREYLHYPPMYYLEKLDVVLYSIIKRYSNSLSYL